jgi:hypothetical protein
MCVHLPFILAELPGGAAVAAWARAGAAGPADRAADVSVAALAVWVVADDAAVAALAPVRLSPRARPPTRVPAATAVPTSGRTILMQFSCLPFAFAAALREAARGPGGPPRSVDEGNLRRISGLAITAR